MTKLPLARSRDLVVQNTDSELLIYDLKTNRAVCLNETARIVFNACDGKTSFEDLERQNKNLNEGIILLAIEELSRENLLAERSDAPLSRRKIMEKAALAAIALPVISGILAPSVAHAQSCTANGGPCSLNNPGACCSKACLSTNGGNDGTCL
ncbi:MAG: hypothetical protein KDB79_15455 [Acidobacteria bacterium]|nr:hypothetical protein [Acidobacteriota bacterium]